MKETLINTIIKMETEQHERVLNRNDMTKAELKLLERLLWKEMNMYGVIDKNDHERNAMHSVWKMVSDYLEENE